MKIQTGIKIGLLALVIHVAWAPVVRAQETLPVPGIDDQLNAQQSPLSQPVPGMQTTQPPARPALNAPAAPSQEQLGSNSAQQAAPQSSSTNILDEMRARAQAPETTQPQAQQNQANTTPRAASEDALPTVQNIKLKTEGLDYTGTDTVNIQMRDTPLDTTDEEYQQGIRDDALEAAANGLFPLQPEEIRKILARYDETREAVETPHYELPSPEVKVETISLDPGVTPPIIKTAVGHVTTITVLDITGAPWPIQDVTWAGDFEVVEPEEGGHIIRITPLANFAYGNVSMRLLTLKTPVTMTLRTTRDIVQYRFDARIPEYGPMAEAPLIDSGREITAGSVTLTQVLDGLLPANAERLEVSGVDGRTTAIQVGQTTYLRTPLTLLSPAWENSVKSADGMNVYAMAETPVVLLSDEGKFRRATLRIVEEGLLDE